VSESRRHMGNRWLRLVALGRPHWRGYLLMWVLTLCSSGLALLQPWPLQILVDHVLGTVPAPGWIAAVLHGLPGAGSAIGAGAWLALAMLCLFVVDATVDVSLTISWLRVAQRGVYEIAGDMFARLQRRSLAFHSTTPVGDSLSRMTADSWCLYNAATALLFAPLHALLVGGAMIVVLSQMNGTLTLIALAAAPVLAASSLVLGRRAERAKGEQRQVESQIESHVQQTLSGIRVVQTFVQEEREHSRFQSLTQRAIRTQRRSALIAGLSSGSAGLATTGGTAAVLGLGALEVIAGRLTIGQLLVFLAYLATLNGQLVQLATAYTTARGLGANLDRMLSVLDAPIDLPERAGAPALTIPAAGAPICFDRVAFEYLPGRPVLTDVSLEASPGSLVAIVGPSGAGKSTLSALVPRLADVTGGRVLICGQDVREVSLADLRRKVAVVLQEPMLLAGTIAENISLGRAEATREEIERAGSAAGLQPLVSRLEHGYQTIVGEGGATLSGGEKQRIAIARAILKDAPILILDEPTSALDAATEAELLKNLEILRRGRTTLVIAHRLSTVRHADVIAVLAGGRLVEMGSHDSLIGRGGIYAMLWEKQSAARPRARREAVA
jgi:ATP-binding cassette, subfamily B, bacterial